MHPSLVHNVACPDPGGKRGTDMAAEERFTSFAEFYTTEDDPLKLEELRGVEREYKLTEGD